MKVVPDSGPAPLIGGTDVPVNIGISADPEDQQMILNVLTNTLYTDKVTAVLREYGCNAFDANVEAGRGHQPIEVRLPNRLDPTVAIRDFGYGMTEQQILQVFIMLGRSTKRNSNAYTGMLGIGSKAGFAYGDLFVVTSYCNGTKTVYNCFRDRDCPKLAKMDEGPTDSPDGIEVKVPVRSGDMLEFVTKAERVFRYFKVRPIIQGAKFDWQAIDKAEFEGKGWRYTGSGQSVAVMGNVGYDLNANAMGGVAPRINTLLQLGVELYFDIGDLEVAANREGLQYRDHTKKSINARLDEMATEITKVFTNRIALAPTLWDAHRMYGDNFEKMGSNQYGVRTLKEVINNHIIWNGIKITTGRFDIRNKEALPGVRMKEVSKSTYYAKKYQLSDNPEYVYASEKTQLCINDLDSKANNSPSRYGGFFEHDTKGMERLVIFTFDDDKVQKKYWKARGLDGAPTINLSTVPLATVHASSSSSPSAHRSKHSAKVFRLVSKPPTKPAYNDAPRSAWWETDSVDLKDDEGVYVKLTKFFVVTPKGNREAYPENFFTLMQPFIKAKLLDKPIYGFKPDRLPKLGPKWELLENYLEHRLAVIMVNAQQEFADFVAAMRYVQLIDYDHVKLFPNGSLMRKLLTEHSRMHKASGAIELMQYLERGSAKEWLAMPTLPTPTVDLADLESQALAAYPLIKHINRDALSHATKAFVTATADYVKMVGK